VSRAWLIGGGLMIVAVVAAAIALLAAGDESASSSATTTPSGLPGGLSEDQQADLEEFRSCMSDQGVELPEPGERPGVGQAPSPEMLSALQACQQYLPEGFAPGGEGPGLRLAPGS
jgi:hypothetical protein